MTTLTTPLVRGSKHRKQNFKELLQLGLLTSVAAAAGCNVYEAKFDDGVDVLLSHCLPGSGAARQMKFLSVQMKATQHAPSGGVIGAPVKRKRFIDYADPIAPHPTIVVVMHVPSNVDDWVIQNSGHLAVSHCAYWVSIRNEPDPTTSTKIVNAPTSQVFDDQALCDIMDRIRRVGFP